MRSLSVKSKSSATQSEGHSRRSRSTTYSQLTCRLELRKHCPLNTTQPRTHELHMRHAKKMIQQESSRSHSITQTQTKLSDPACDTETNRTQERSVLCVHRGIWERWQRSYGKLWRTQNNNHNNNKKNERSKKATQPAQEPSRTGALCADKVCTRGS